MASQAFLTATELIDMTGYKMPSKQIAWLTRNGLKHWVSRTGRPVVPRAAVEGHQRQDDAPFQLGTVR